jgi:caffeoyl-CoA O-methyltransferase
MRRFSSDRLNYIRNTFCQPSEAAKSIEQDIRLLNLPEIHLLPEEAKILQFLIYAQNISTIVEIGTHAGYSTIWMAEALKGRGKIYTIEKDQNRAQIARKNFVKYNYLNIELLEGDAIEVLSTVERFGPFDMLFIDANKTKYIDYLDWGEKNIRPGGLIIADNVLLFGTLYQEEHQWPCNVSKKMVSNMKLFNKRINDHENFFTIFIPTDEGLSISIKLS